MAGVKFWRCGLGEEGYNQGALHACTEDRAVSGDPRTLFIILSFCVAHSVELRLCL